MSSISADYERFLYANFPDEYRRITVKDVKEDVIQAIKSRLDDEYAIWCQIPEWIKNEYRDNLPDEVLNGNVAVKNFILKEEKEASVIDNKKEEVDDNSLTDYGLRLLALGYAAESVALLTQNRAERERLLRKANGRRLEGEDLRRWFATKESDCKIILKDWKENQQEKYFMRVVKEMSRTKGKKERANSENERIALEMKEASLNREFRRLAKQLENEEFRRKVINYLRLETQQAGLRHLDSEVLDKVIGVFAEHGIKIQPRANDGRNDLRLDKDSLAYELKEQYLMGTSVDCEKKANEYRSKTKKSKNSTKQQEVEPIVVERKARQVLENDLVQVKSKRKSLER